MLVKRWGLLRKPLPATIPLRKIVALVISLCRLHNYCVNRFIAKVGMYEVPPPLAIDSLEIVATGGVTFQSTSNNQNCPSELLDGGEHHDDTGEAYRRQFSRRNLGNKQLPRALLLAKVEAGGFKRPTPKKWQQQSQSQQSQ